MQVLKTPGSTEESYRDSWRPTIAAIEAWLAAYPLGGAPQESTEKPAADDPWGLKEMETAPAAAETAESEAPGFGFFDEVPEAAGFGFFEDEAPEASVSGAATPRPRSGAMRAVSPAATTLEYLLCENDGQHYAVPVGFVREVIAAVPLADVPRAPDAVGGIIRLRDEFIPVIKRSAVFGDKHGTKSTTVRQCIIVCEIGTKKFGIQVEKVHQVLEHSGADLQSLSESGAKRGGMIGDIGTIAGHSVLFIDLAKIELG
jgi:chemotaxis signal transduction protein